jgi:multiple sugar transport system substrate-binding protein
MALMLIFSLLSGCSGSASDSVDANAVRATTATSGPATVTFYLSGAEAVFFNDFTVDAVKKKYPQITLKLITAKNFADDLEKMVAAKEPLPDVVGASPGGMSTLQDLNLLIDLNPYFKKSTFNPKKLNPQLLAAARGYSDKGELLIIPYDIETALLVYNKDLFDKFGVGYPKDGLTWEQTMDLARKLSRSDSGVNYRGFDVNTSYFMNNNPLSVPYVNTKTGKQNTGDPRWNKLFTMLKEFNDIPGNEIVGDLINKTFSDAFLKDRTLAMAINPLNQLQNAETSGASKGLNWDIAAVPFFNDAPKTGLQMNYHFFGITPTSQVKDAAFAVIEFLLSDETVKGMARQGKQAALEGKVFETEFGKEVGLLNGKHMEAFFYDKLANRAEASTYDAIVSGELLNAYKDIMLNGKDVNTAIREAGERADQSIDAAKNK